MLMRLRVKSKFQCNFSNGNHIHMNNVSYLDLFIQIYLCHRNKSNLCMCVFEIEWLNFKHVCRHINNKTKCWPKIQSHTVHNNFPSPKYPSIMQMRAKNGFLHLLLKPRPLHTCWDIYIFYFRWLFDICLKVSTTCWMYTI